MSRMHIDELDITQIRLLAELSRLRSVSRAAQRIGISQSAASHALAKLRKISGDPLFARTQDGLQPTPFGSRLSTASCEALDVLLSGLTASDQFDPRTTTRVFSFFMNDIGQTIFLPPLIKYLKQTRPVHRRGYCLFPLTTRGRRSALARSILPPDISTI
jgi:molybdate transport repressor ModE-like protein